MNQYHTNAPPQQQPRYVWEDRYVENRVVSLVYDTVDPRGAWLQSSVTVRITP